MIASVNKVILLGTIGQRGVEVSYVGQGTAKASFMLGLSEQGQDGKLYTTWQPVEVWGKRAEAAGELEPGQLVLIEGKLKRQKRGESSYETIVTSFEAVPVGQATTLTGNPA